MKYPVGKVVGVEEGQVAVTLYDLTTDADGNSVGVPESMKVTVTGSDGPFPLLIGQPGSFVEIQLPSGSMLGVVVGIRMQESPVPEGKPSMGVPLAGVQRRLTVTPVGKFSGPQRFERGCDDFPTVNAEVYAVVPETVSQVYRSFTEGGFSIGTLSILPGQRACLDLDAFLGRHAAVLGQTGGGKSWAVASILQKVAALPRATMLLLDWHGEYAGTFREEADYISANALELPYWLMNFEELAGLCIDRAESAAPNQIAKFRELLQAEKERAARAEGLDLPKITLDTPVYFRFDAILSQLHELDTRMVAGANGRTKQGDCYGQFSRMIMRLQSRLNDRRYDLLFRPNRYVSSGAMTDLFKAILGEGHPAKKLVVLDISPVPFDVRNSVVSLLLRLVFDFAYWHRRALAREYPIFVACDEAHAYLDADSASNPARLAAERIAKEGRKYGVGLMVVSQRPREVSPTILSQCGTFLCMRLTNPDDQAYVRRLLPDATRGVVDMMASLRKGECLLLGEAVMMPTRIRMDVPDPPPGSGDVSFIKLWAEQAGLELDAVIDEWRRQGVPRGGGAPL